jgi:hypothetical protein
MRLGEEQAELHVQLSLEYKVHTCLAEDAQEASGPVRMYGMQGRRGAWVQGWALSDSQRTPHAGPALLRVLQAAG